MADIFISHIESEKRLAGFVETLLQKSVAPTPSVFLSSNIFTLTGGEPFEERIRSEILSCRAFVGMYSDVSFHSHWVHLESGAAWALGKRVIPVCYGGRTFRTLPRPYSSFHAVDLRDPYKLVIAIADALGTIPPPPPGIHLSGEKFEKGILYTGDPYEDVLEELTAQYPQARS